jgi:hypothetical protein
MMAEQGEGLLYGAANAGRQPFFKFTKPVYDANQWLVSSARRRWCSIAGKTCATKVISIGGGGKFGPEFEARRDRLFKIEQNNASTENRLKMLSTHRVARCCSTASAIRATERQPELPLPQRPLGRRKSPSDSTAAIAVPKTISCTNCCR